VLGLLGLLMGAHRLIRGMDGDNKPALSRHEADYYRPHGKSKKE
jgi:hypothetical protein